MNKILLTIGMALAVMVSNAQTNSSGLIDKTKLTLAKGITYVQPSHYNSDLFNDNELVLGLSGTYTSPEPKGLTHLFVTDARHGVYGVNLEVTYWKSKYFGVGLDTGVRDYNNVQDNVLDYATLSVSLRYPIGHLAPSLSGGAGRNWADGRYYAQFGGGLEWRFTKSVGWFADARFTKQSAESNDSVTGRSGLRIVF